MKKYFLFLVSVFFLFVFASNAFAEYGYHVNKRGTGYWRDDSNDGNPHNNANALGMNDNSDNNSMNQNGWL